MINGQCLTTMMTSHQGSTGQDMRLGVLSMTYLNLCDYNLFTFGLVLQFLRWPQFRLQEIAFSTMCSYIPLDSEPAAGYRRWPVASNLHSGYKPVGLSHGQGCFWELVHSVISLNATVAWRPAEMNMCAFVTQNRRKIMIWQIKGSHCLHPRSPASRTLSQNLVLHHGELGPYASNSLVL